MQRNTSGIAVKLSEWTRDVDSDQERSICRRTMADVVHEEEAYLSSPVRRLTMMSTLIYLRTKKTSRTLLLTGARNI